MNNSEFVSRNQKYNKNIFNSIGQLDTPNTGGLSSQKMSAKSILIGTVNGIIKKGLFYQYVLKHKTWRYAKELETLDEIFGVFEIDNICYVVSSKGSSLLTTDNKLYKFPSNKEFRRCTAFKLRNKIAVFGEEFFDNDFFVFSTIDKSWGDVEIRTERTDFAVTEYLKDIWLVGGHDNNQALDTIEIFKPDSKTQTLSSVKMTQKRQSHSVIVYKNQLFVFGGCDTEYNSLKSVEKYTPKENKFVTMAPMKIARDSFACCRVENLVYVIGGNTQCSQQGPSGFSTVVHNSVEVYNLDSNVWTEGKDCPGTNLFSKWHACVLDKKLKST